MLRDIEKKSLKDSVHEEGEKVDITTRIVNKNREGVPI